MNDERKVMLSITLNETEARCLAIALKRVHRRDLWTAALTARSLEEKAEADKALYAIANALALKGFRA